MRPHTRQGQAYHPYPMSCLSMSYQRMELKCQQPLVLQEYPGAGEIRNVWAVLWCKLNEIYGWKCDENSPCQTLYRQLSIHSMSLFINQLSYSTGETLNVSHYIIRLYSIRCYQAFPKVFICSNTFCQLNLLNLSFSRNIAIFRTILCQMSSLPI